MVVHKAQDVGARPRTEDIRLSEDIDFKSMLLPDPILKGLKLSGYIRPSPIQKKALPLVRCGLDLIVQAKAGTGKTCVFAVAALEMVQPSLPHLQAVILAPTREIALQITEVFSAIGQAIEGLKIGSFIGGYPIALDQQNAVGCHIAVGSPGRIRHLMHKGLLDPSRARLFVLDEADKLMEQAFIRDINEIFSYLPDSKQVLALSATYTPELIQHLSNYMNHGQFVTPQKTSDSTVLVGVRQFISVLTHHVDKLARLRLKERHLLYLLRSIPFNQCLVFSNLQSRAVSVCVMLRKEGWGVEWIAGSQDQADRTIAISQMKEQKVRVLVTTDLTARGIDVENVNLVINLDVPRDYQTYLHRMGRAGRYGSLGMVVTILAAGDELIAFQKLLGAIGGSSQAVDCVPEDLRNVDLWSSTDKKFDQVFGIVENTEPVTDASEKSPERTENGVKCSIESSNGSKSPVINSCDDDINVPLEDTCSCNLFEAAQSDIKSVSGPSLFSLAQKETHWRDVLPVIVNEFQIPLNTPLASIDTKLIRVRCLSNKSRKEIENVDQIKNPVCFSDFETSCDNDSTFLTFDEIKSTLENEDNVHINLDNIPEMNGDFLKYTVENEDNVHINLDNRPEMNGDFLSVEELENVLENDVTKCELKEEDNCTPFTEVDQVLIKYNKDKTKLEDSLIDFDSFDVVGWMAVDEKHNIVENIIHDKLSILEFEVVDCPSGKKHVKVVSSFNKDYEKDIFEDHILTLDIKNFGLDQSFSLQMVAEKITVIQDFQETRINTLTNKMCSSFFKTSQDSNIPLPSGAITNWYTKHQKNKTTSKHHESEKYEEDEDIHVSDKTIKKCNSSKNDTKSSLKNKLLNKNEMLSSINNSVKKSVLGNSNTNTQNICIPKQAEKVHRKPESSSRSAQSSKLDLQAESQEKFLLKTSYQVPTSQNTDKDRDSLSSTERFSDSSSESDIPSSMIAKRSYSNGIKKQPHQSSISSEDPIPCIDRTQNLEKWQKLHDCEESDSESSSKSDLPDITNCSVKHLSGSSSNMKTFHASKSRKLPRQRKHNHANCEYSSSNSYDTYDSDVSYPHSFKTACSQQLACGEMYKDDIYVPPYVAFNHFTHPSDMAEKFYLLQNHEEQELAHRHGRISDSHFPKKRDQAPKATSKDYEASNPHQYQGGHFKREQKTIQEIPQECPKRLTSKNLFYDWYSTWYTELRHRANQVGFIEYMNAMSTP